MYGDCTIYAEKTIFTLYAFIKQQFYKINRNILIETLSAKRRGKCGRDESDDCIQTEVFSVTNMADQP